MNIKDAYIHNGDAILKDIKLNGSKLQKLKAGKNADDTYLIWDDVVDLSPFGASGHNHDDRYFKLTGGKITGPITFEMSNDRKIYINNSDDETYWSLISFQQKGTEYGTLGTAGSTDLQWNGHNLYHAGNLTASVIGGLGTLSNNISGNAATATNADKLDGVHYQNILERINTGYSESGTATGWFRIAETLTNDAGGITFLLAIQRNYNYTNNESYLFSISISYNGGISITQLSGYANSRLITKIRVDWSNSQIAYIDLYINASYTNNGYSWYTVGCAKSYTAWTANPTLVGNAYEFTTVNGCKSDRGFTGDLSGNATSATKLQNSRTIWGQSFDGTKNISGALTEVTDITASGNVSCSNLILPLGGKIHNGGNFGLYISGSAGDYGSAIYLTHDHGKNQTAFRIHSHYDSNLGGLTIGFSTTTQNYGASPIDATYDDILHIRGNGNIGIGTTSPSYKLHVVGDIYTTTGFKKNGSSDNYVLLGGGGHKLLSDFSMAHSHPYLPLSGGTLTGSVTMRGMDTNLVRDIVYDGTSGWARDLIALQVDGVSKFSVAAYGNYTAGASDNGIYYGYIGCNDYNGFNLRISDTSLTWGDNPILHSGNYNSYAPTLTGTGASGTWSISITGNAKTATTSTYASNVGSSGTAGTNYVTAANVISMYNWYNSITATDEASNTAIDKWNEIVSFLSGITDTSTLSGILAGYAAAGHNHDGRYIKWDGSAADTNAMAWGTLTTANGYTILSHAASSDGGDWGMANQSGKIYMQLDGYYYQNEGQYRVTDVSETVTALGTNGNYLTWTKNGTTNNITVPYATKAGNADTLDNIDSTGFLRQVVVPNNAENDFNTFSNMTLTGRVDPTTGALLKNAPWTDRGPAGGYGVLTYLFDKHSASYGTQIAVGYNSNRIYIRSRYWGDSGVVWDTTWDSLALTSEVTNLLAKYLPLTGGTVTGPIEISTGALHGYYREGLRITRAKNNWAGITFGSTGLSGAPTNGWFAALNPSDQFIISPNDSSTNGLTLNAGGDVKWRNNTIWHTGNDGSGSGLDADLLDGKHNGELTAQYFSAGVILTKNDSINCLLSGVYSYINANNPTGSIGNNCILISFRNKNRADTLQIVGAGNEQALYYRIATNVGDSTYENWTTWRELIHSGNISSQSVNYADSAGNADTVDNLHASNFVKFYLSPLAGSAPASSAKSWFENTMPSGAGAIVYNVPGSEKTIIVGKSTGAYGHMLQLNYDDKYLRILRYYAGNWKSDDWEKISAGYADTAGSVTWDNVTGKPINFKAYSGSLTSGGWKIMQGNNSSPSIAISYNNEATNWNSGTYSATLVYGCEDTRGLIDCAYSTPKVTFGGCSFGSSTDDNPTWYFKLAGTTGTEYNLNSMPYAESAGSVERATFGDRYNGTHDANAMTSNGLYYYTSNGPTTNAHNFETNDGSMYVQAYNSSWVSQIAQDYRSGKLAVRSRNDGTWQPWRRIAFADSDYVISADRMYYEPEHRKFTRTASGNSWNTQAYSVCGYKECRITYRISQTNARIMVGLNSDPTTDAGYWSIDYCWYTENGGSLCIYENNTYVSSISDHTTYTVGDELIIEYSCGQVRYYHNGVLCRTVARTYGSPLYFDCSFYEAGSIENVIFEPIHDSLDFVQTTASYSLSNAAWTNTITLPTTAGSYILNIVSSNSTLTGVFSIGASDNAKDEISLHLHGNGPRLYARTNGTTLQLSSNDASATSRSVTIKYRRMI